jgi:hypothetical protein
VKTFGFHELQHADLFVDAIYEGGTTGNVGDDPINRLLPGSGNLGGFRAAGRGDAKTFIVLYTSGEDKDWPDSMDLATGQFTYFGDNKRPGQELHDTRPGGNIILRNVFEWLHAEPQKRKLIPPFFVFTKSPTSNSPRSVQFRGLVVPGYPGMPPTEDLIALWKTTNGQRFQNYRGVFSILNVPVVPRTWLKVLDDKVQRLERSPKTWKKWVETGTYELLRSEPTTIIRTPQQQTPDTDIKTDILRTVFEHFNDSPVGFEHFAALIFQMQDRRVTIDEITRGTIDGGKDAIGRYRLGLVDDPVHVEFALEAKCYQPPIDGCTPSTVGVKEVARLVSRLRHRQFGVLVTTSVVARQAYQEVREDRHPIVFISGKDIADTLVSCGYTTSDQVRVFLLNEFPTFERKTI